MIRFDEHMHKVIPSLPNPYRIHACLTGAVGLIGWVALDYYGWEPSWTHPAVFLIGVVITLQLHSLSGKGARVWLAKQGVMVNRNVFFHRTFGMRTFAWKIKPEHDRYLFVPVTAEYRGFAEDTVRSWVPVS